MPLRTIAQKKVFLYEMDNFNFWNYCQLIRQCIGQASHIAP